MDDKQQAIKDNMNLVYYLIHRYYPTFSKDEDIIQCGMVGLCIAVDKWSNKGDFAAYARKWILGEIKRELRDRSSRSLDISLESLMEGKPDEY